MVGDEVEMMIQMQKDIAGIKAILSTMANTNDMALKAYESAKSAHHRLDRMDQDIDGLEKSQNWLPKVITSCVVTGIVGGLIGFAISNLGG